MSLRLKIFLPLFFFSALLFGYLYGYWMPHSLFHAEDEYRKSTESHIESVMEDLVPLLLSGQIDAIHENLNTLMRKHKEWVNIKLVDPQGKTIYPLHTVAMRDLRSWQDINTFEKQITHSGTNLGKLVLMEDCRPRLGQIRKEHRELMLTLSIILGVFFVCVVVLIERVVSRPIKFLADAVKRLADGDFDAPLLKIGHGEIGTLVDSFGDMRDAIKGYQAELTRKNESLKEEHEFLHTIIGSLTQPFYVIDAESYKVLLANKVAYNGDKIPENMTCYKMTHARNEPCRGGDHPCSVAEVKKTKRPAVLEHVHSDEKGDKRTYEIYAYPFFDKEGNVSKVIEYCIDITDKKRSEEEHKKMTAQILQMQKMEAIGTLAGGIAHDFNNMLAAMIGYCELIRYSIPEDSNVHEMIDKILNAGNRARNLVRQILSFSRQTEQMRIPVKIQPIVREAVSLLRASMPTTIEIRCTIDECDPVLADMTQVHQIIMNLCTNAYHAMRHSGGVLGVSLKKVEIKRDGHSTAGMVLNPGEYLKLEVSDTGHGIERAVLDRIFDPFFTTKEIGEGTGMGLAVVHGIVKSHGGHITVYSEPNIGTTFNVYLPVSKSAQAQQNAESSLDVRPSIESMPGGNERILLIDDEQEVLTMEHQILEKLGYSVKSLTAPSDALTLFESRPDEFDLVVTDMTMPVMTGMELAMKILSIRGDMPIVLCTGFSELMTAERAKSIGIREYIMKPILMSDIAKLVRKVLDAKKTGEPVATGTVTSEEN